MRIFIIYTPGGPFAAYIDKEKAYKEYNRLYDLDDLVSYSIIELPIQKQPLNKPLELTGESRADSQGTEINEGWDML